MKVSIVIPSYGSCDLLDECLNRIYRNTDVIGHEIIVVCNGADDDSAQIVMQNGLKLVWVKEAIGFTLATNMGLKLATNPITLVMNTDAHILDYWPKNKWLDELTKPFENPKVGIVGTNVMYSRWGDFLPFFCTAIRTSLFSELGYLDEAFSPGYGEDLDFCVRTRLAGYELVSVDEDESINDNANEMMVSSYPLYHRGAQSFTDEVKRQEYIRNHYVVMTKKWGPSLKF
jgi:GT2 family glycosyltransferase